METGDPLEFLARLVTHIPNPGQVMTRYYGWYASRTRGARRRQATAGEAQASVPIIELADWTLRAARYRWAELLRRIFEVDPLSCPRCRGPMRILAVLTDPAQIARILAHRARALERTRSPPPRRRRAAPRTEHPPAGRSPARGLGWEAQKQIPIPTILALPHYFGSAVPSMITLMTPADNLLDPAYLPKPPGLVNGNVFGDGYNPFLAPQAGETRGLAGRLNIAF